MVHRLRRALSYTLKNTQTRLVLFLTISVFFIILGVGFTSYLTSQQVLQEELGEPQYQLLEISKGYIDEYIQESNLIAAKVALHPNIYEFLTGEEQNSYENITDIYELFTTLISNTPYINSIYVHDMRRGSFVSIPQGYSSSRLTFADSEWVDVADEFGNEKMLVRKRTLPKGAGNKGSEITLFRKITIQNEFVGIVAINLAEDELFAKLHPPQRSHLERSRFIVDAQGNVLYAAENSDFAQSDLQHVQLQEGSAWTIRHEDRSYLVNQLVSPVTGWKYISVVSQDSLLEKSKLIRDAVLAVSVAALLFGILVIFYIHSSAFRPVRRMQQLFKAVDRDIYGSDLHHLERLTEELFNNHTQLSKLMRQTIQDASSKFLFDIYIGSMNSNREVREKWGRYFAGWDDAPLTIAMLSIDDYDKWCARYPSNDHSLLKFALANVMTEIFSSSGWRSVCADFGKDKLAILLQPTSNTNLPQSLCEEAVQVVNRLLGFSASIGVSEPQDDVVRLKQAMLESENALGYRLFKGYGKVIFFSEVSGHEMPDVRSMEAAVDDLSGSIEAGDAERSVRLLSGIVQEVCDKEWYPSAALSMLTIVGEKLRSIDEGEEKEPWFMNDAFENWNTLDVLEIERLLREKVEQLSERYRVLTQSKEFVLCQQMIEYMKEHLEDPIGIDQIAESAGISVSLASQFFKKEMNDTIYGYFTKLRMDRAGELLVETDDKISDIAMQVGYQHENSFIRVFRKYKDITPGKYRELMKIRKDAMKGSMFPAYARDQT